MIRSISSGETRPILLPIRCTDRVPDLADLYRRPFGQFHAGQFHGKRETGPLCLARDCHRDHRTGSRIKDIMANDDNGTLATLLVTSRGIQIGPEYFAS
jgi:hypothetical protein